MSDLTPDALKLLEQAWDAIWKVHPTKDEFLKAKEDYYGMLLSMTPDLIAAAEECERLRERVKNLESQLKQAIDLVQELERGRRPKT